MTSWWIRLTALSVAALVLVATRVPGQRDVWTYVVLVGAAVLIGLAGLAVHPKGPASARSGVFVVALGLLLVPASGQAWLAAVADEVVAVVVVVALHVFFFAPETAAPLVGPAASRRASWRNAVRFLPAIVTGSVLLALPWVWRWLLPPRIHAAYELQGALAPLVPLAFVAAFLVAGGLVVSTPQSTLRDAKTDEATEPERPDAAVRGDAA